MNTRRRIYRSNEENTFLFLLRVDGSKNSKGRGEGKMVEK